MKIKNKEEEIKYFGESLEKLNFMIGKKFQFEDVEIEIIEFITRGSLEHDNLVAYFICMNLSTKEIEQWIPEDLVKAGVVRWISDFDQEGEKII